MKKQEFIADWHIPMFVFIDLVSSYVLFICQVHLFLYDTAGQERFADMAASYYRVGEAVVP